MKGRQGGEEQQNSAHSLFPTDLRTSLEMPDQKPEAHRAHPEGHHVDAPPKALLQEAEPPLGEAAPRG